jgi:hypothetical protein
MLFFRQVVGQTIQGAYVKWTSIMFQIIGLRDNKNVGTVSQSVGVSQNVFLSVLRDVVVK